MYYLNQWGYKTLEHLGKGAFAQVYLVKKNATGLLYACKVSDKKEMLQRESLILQQITYPLFPVFHDFKQSAQAAYLFMEYVPGANLKTLITKQGALSEKRTIEIAMELAKGLEYLHERKPPILYRDLKPDNIMVKEDGSVKLLDFGSAGQPDTVNHVITGTPGFAAPEQWEAGGNVSFYSDVYGLAKVMYYMLSAEKPESVDCRKGKLKISTRKIHRGVKCLLEDCLRRDTGERIPDMRCFLRRLEPYYNGRRRDVLRSESAACFRKGDVSEYIFQKNILKG